tara:strand:- start:954 stop:1199 length:246 start_codon:yes stop_codon:yes gene_type:complete
MNGLEIVSNILNDSKVYNKIAKALGIKLDPDSDIFKEIEEYIVEQYDEMDNNRPTEKCGNCNNEVINQVFCCRECSKEYYA